MAVRSRCCGGVCSLQMGTFIIGTLRLIWNLYMIVRIVHALDAQTNSYDELWGEYDTKTYLYVAFTIAIFQTIFNIILLLGAIQETPILLLLWMLVETLSAIALIVILIGYIINQFRIPEPIIIIIYFLVNVYFLIVVIRYYRTLCENSRPPEVRDRVEMCEVRQT